jgi:predicted GH43/DUF377 family glycosyl hydrolase
MQITEHLPRHIFLSMLKGCQAIVGNSSAGLIEAAILGVPCVNIGPRQNGREKPGNVIDCDYGKASVQKVDEWQIDPQPTFMPDPEHFPEELWGIEDPRITYVPELGQYAIVYTAFTRDGPGVALAFTEDFCHFERYGLIMSPDDKDAALLPHRIGGHWALIHRPISSARAHMWISYSADLWHWGSDKIMMEARRGAWWDANKIGLSPPPIETAQGWLVIYHGVRQTASGSLYRLGLALFDLESPERCLKRGDEWVFGPEQPYELHGDVDNVAFPCGYTLLPDGDTLHLYYGAADTSIALATGSIRAMLEWLEQHG